VTKQYGDGIKSVTKEGQIVKYAPDDEARETIQTWYVDGYKAASISGVEEFTLDTIHSKGALAILLNRIGTTR
jgi:hypothetical protein